MNILGIETYPGMTIGELAKVLEMKTGMNEFNDGLKISQSKREESNDGLQSFIDMC